MSIRADFQPRVDEFISDLNDFATGSYLQEGETDLWEAPFDVAALPKVKKTLEKLLDAFDAVPADPTGDVLKKVVASAYTELEKINRSFEDAVIEPEERAAIEELVYDAAAATGADDEALGELPDFE
ncbi:hypothetical protein [Corynebacterium tapiri]|uniref:Uncharacterized protein n=1 Tax=Corynebacterium tapiri TaxID=1448266 RepID=A0A5C4U526_9CORY|nr:hypothetical protein [Corynebacterium tapiri]TNL97603.1 hypothetical protein FHE74_05805 [Corynebacterium tapiri]